MKIRNIKLVIVLIMLHFISCSFSFVKISDTYKRKSINGKSLAVSMVDSKIIVRCSGDLGDEFDSGNENIDELILQFFKKQIVLDIKNNTTFESVILRRNYSKPICRKEKIKTKEGSDYVLVPKHGENLYYRDGNYDYILLLDDIYIGTEMIKVDLTHTSINGSAREIASYDSKILNYSAKFVIWDNSEKQEIAYGKIKSSSSSEAPPIIEMANWNEVSRLFIYTIFKKTPFDSFPISNQ